MDSLIKRFDFQDDDDLRICARGVAYQKDMTQRKEYGGNYFGYCEEKYTNANPEMNQRLQKIRCDFVRRHYHGNLMDIGIGDGSFIKSRNSLGLFEEKTFGHDNDPKALEWLKEKELILTDFWDTIRAYSFWDVLEHLDMPETYLQRICRDSFVFVSIPIFESLKEIRKSIHYRPGEHLYYFTHEGFVNWMNRWGFSLIEHNTEETEAGRAQIGSYAFIKDGCDQNHLIGQYQEIHSTRYYGASSSMFLKQIALHVMALDPLTILDYGCGRSDLVAHFWKDGGRRISRYDPAIPTYSTLPPGGFDLVLCNDLMEHILMRDIDNVFREIKSKSKKVIFTISLKPARTKLPDGRNAHVTLLTEGEWERWIREAFGTCKRSSTDYEHIFLARTFR